MIRGKLWKNIPHFSSKFSIGDHVAIKGNIIDYRNTKEIKVDFINKVTNSLYEVYGFSDSLLTSSSFKDINKKYIYIYDAIESLSIKQKKIIKKIYNKNRETILEIPSIDYKIKGGYVHQVYNVLLLFNRVNNNKFDKDLIITGILLKYIGLLKSFDSTNPNIPNKNSFKDVKIFSLDIISTFLKSSKKNLINNLKNIIIANKNYQEAMYVEYLFKIERLSNKSIE